MSSLMRVNSSIFFTEQMDTLLHQCFFHALKCKVKKSELPLLTSTFLRNYMFSCWYVTSLPLGRVRILQKNHFLLETPDLSDNSMLHK